MFGKKSRWAVFHYEGLPGFKQDTSCNIEIEDDAVLFTNKGGGSVRLPFAQIQGFDLRGERDFWGKYYNNRIKTTNLITKWFHVISYVSSSGEDKYIAFWTGNSSPGKLRKELNSRIAPKSVTL